MKVFNALVVALAATFASAFVQPTGRFSTTVQRASSMKPLQMAYVPDGLTPAQFKAIKAKEEAAKKASKNKKRGSIEDLTDW